MSLKLIEISLFPPLITCLGFRAYNYENYVERNQEQKLQSKKKINLKVFVRLGWTESCERHWWVHVLVGFLATAMNALAINMKAIFSKFQLLKTKSRKGRKTCLLRCSVFCFATQTRLFTSCGVKAKLVAVVF